MIIDFNLTFNTAGSGKKMCDFGNAGTGQTVTASAASEKTLDTVASGDAVAIGAALACRCIASADGTGSGTIAVALQTSDDKSTWKTLLQTGGVVGSEIKAGDTIADFRVPQGCKRYLRVNYVVSGTVTATVNSFLTKEF